MELLYFKRDSRDPVIAPNGLLKSLTLMKAAGCTELDLNERVRKEFDKPVKK